MSVVLFSPELSIHLKTYILKVDISVDLLHVTFGNIVVCLLGPVTCMRVRQLLSAQQININVNYLSIYENYKTPLRGAPTPGLGKNNSFKELVKGAGQIPWKRVELRWETAISLM